MGDSESHIQRCRVVFVSWAMIMEHNFACVFASVVKTMDACEPDSGGHASEKVNKNKNVFDWLSEGRAKHHHIQQQSCGASLGVFLFL